MLWKTVKPNKKKRLEIFTSLDANSYELVITSTFNPSTAFKTAKKAIINDFPNPVDVCRILLVSSALINKINDIIWVMRNSIVLPFFSENILTAWFNMASFDPKFFSLFISYE